MKTQTSRLTDTALIRLAELIELRVMAIDTKAQRAWRIYTDRRAAYRQWTLQRLAKIEADEG